ncbi:MAG: type II secretion system minor pseudopilin GspK [Burkholderiaceae bacterium]
MTPRPTARRQRGAALLLALLIMTLVATLAAGMVWLQWRGIEVETAERARGQAQWLLNASLDWGNLILKSSIRRTHNDDDLGQPWATPLAETKLSSFLSADGRHSDDSGPEAYLSGQITDAQSKYNLYNLVVFGPSTGKTTEIVRLQTLFQAIGVSPDVATTIAANLRASASASAQQNAGNTGTQVDPAAMLMPVELRDLAWYGIDPKVIKQMEPFVQIIAFAPQQVQGAVGAPNMAINVNTAPAEAIMAGCPGLSRAQAEQLILQRRQRPFDDAQQLAATLKGSRTGQLPCDGQNSQPGLLLDVKSSFFEIYGQLRYEQHVIRERSVIYRKDQFTPVQVLRRERLPPDAT